MDRFVVYAPLKCSCNWFLRCMMGNKDDWTHSWLSAGCWHEDEEEFIKIKEKIVGRKIRDSHIITEFELVQMSMLVEDFSDEDRSDIKTTHLLEFLPTRSKLELTEDEVIRVVREMKPDVSYSQLEARLKNDEPKFEIDVVGLKLAITKKDEGAAEEK